MRVLVSNDDGVDAPGIHVLARHLATVRPKWAELLTRWRDGAQAKAA